METELSTFDNVDFNMLSKEGYALIKQNKCAKAIEVFRTILDADSNNVYALVGIGDALRKQKEYTKAHAYYERCLEDNPTNSFAIFGIADILRSQEKYAEAIRYWERYLLYDANNIAVITRTADCYRRIDNVEKSKEYYNKALALDAKNCYAFIGLGWLYFGIKDFPHALKIWLQVLKCPHDKDDIRVYTTIGNCYYKLKEYDNAIKYYNMAADRAPDNFYVLFGLANCYRGISDYKKSIEYLDKVLKKDSRNQVILSRLGDLYANISEFKKAKEYYVQALKIKFDVFATFGMARLAYREGRYDDAITELAQLLRHTQISTRVHRELEQYAQDPNLSTAQKNRILTMV